MSAGGAWGGARGLQPRAPEKGVFPLDHFGECKQVHDRPPTPLPLLELPESHRGSPQLSTSQPPCKRHGAAQVKDDYLACLKQHNNNAQECREVAKLYLACRMERCGEQCSCTKTERHAYRSAIQSLLTRVGISWPSKISETSASVKQQNLQQPLRPATVASVHSLSQEEGDQSRGTRVIQRARSSGG